MQFRALVDGPRGLMAEALRTTHTNLPSELKEAFSYLIQHSGTAKSIKPSHRSRRSTVTSKQGGGSSVGSVGDVEVDDDIAVIEGGLNA